MNKEDYKIAYENVMIANKMLEQEIERLHSIIKEVRELIEEDYFEDGSFENYYKVMSLLKGE